MKVTMNIMLPDTAETVTDTQLQICAAGSNKKFSGHPAYVKIQRRPEINFLFMIAPHLL
ncbi:hypothetical protein [Eisenbergiella massiliensis]|uniref:hypothetical protein n=1 Tax=Eisenbergiella massiliensis TaxID=1720294 RepID=UPI0015E194CB|nr:hypothetical protein [Eisenbergiella massiliensis]